MNQPSFHGYFNIQQRRVLLAAEDVAVSGTSAVLFTIDREFDRIGGIEFDEIADSFFGNAVQFCNCRFRQRPALFDQVVVFLFPEDDIEGDLVRSRVFASDRLGKVDQFYRSSLSHLS